MVIRGEGKQRGQHGQERAGPGRQDVDDEAGAGEERRGRNSRNQPLMLPPIAVRQRRVIEVIALSVEPPIPRYLRNPRLGDWLSHSSATGLLGNSPL